MGNKRKKQRLRQSVFALLLAVTMVLGMMPQSLGPVYAAETTAQAEEKQTALSEQEKEAISNAGNKLVSFLSRGDAAPASAFDVTDKKADGDTRQTWQPLALDTTANIGRIWTDKTVSADNMVFQDEDMNDTIEIGDSQFLVALSALSSTSNTVVTSSKPLDIMLVLDVSGSMDEALGYDYTPTYNVNTNGWTAYYAKNENGSYTKIERATTGPFWNPQFDHWELNGETVEPKESADDSNGIQFYIYRRVKKMDALTTAVNSFVTAAAKQNDSIADTAKRHHISVVKFATNSYNNDYGNDFNRQDYNFTQCLNPLTAYDSKNVSELTGMIDELSPAGATASDFGLKMAQQELTAHGRSDAQKVIIFFTDGEPNHQSGFDSTVANAAITTAKTLKTGGALVYSGRRLCGCKSCRYKRTFQRIYARCFQQLSECRKLYRFRYCECEEGRLLQSSNRCRRAEQDFYRYFR